MNALAQAALRGAVGAMAMTGMRVLTTELGWVDKPPPQQIFHERVDKDHSRAAQELTHWLYGALGGVQFRLLPAPVRALPGAGPAYGLALWLGFELALAPALDLSHHDRHGARAHAALLADHALYGAILTADR